MKASKIVIAVASIALVLAAIVGGVFFFQWLRDPQRIATAKGESIIAQNLAAPLDMTSRIQTPASTFSQIQQFPAWQYVPIGFQTFCNVPLHTT